MATTPYDTYIINALSFVKNIRANSVAAGAMPTIFQNESGGNPNAVSPTGATGLGQTLVSTARAAAKGLGLDWSDLSDTQVQAMLKDPQLNVTISLQAMVMVENEILGWPGVQKSGLPANTSALQAVMAASWALGTPTVKPMVASALKTTKGSWNPQTTSNFLAIFGSASQASNQKYYGKTAGPSTSAAQLAAAATSPIQTAASDNLTPGSDGLPVDPTGVAPPLNNPGTTQNPQALSNTIPDGLDVQAWFDANWANYGGVAPTGNPDMRSSLEFPALFSLSLDQGMKASLNDSQGRIILIPLNVSINSFNLRNQHLVHRTPTATGLLLTFWGSQPGTITARGSTGLMRNGFGITALGSNRLAPSSSEFYDALLDAYPNAGSDGIAEPWSTPNVLRVAAQDAFAELLLLFKNNGVLRFLPPSRVPEQTGTAGQPLWSPSEGATGYQMASRTGDIRRRGYVVFSYRQATYMGYFKSMNLTADANIPFQWNFDFTFRVEKAVVPVFKYKTQGA